MMPSAPALNRQRSIPRLLPAMAEIGIDIREQHSKGLYSLSEEAFDEVVTLCGHAEESGPIVPSAGAKRHHGFDDPTATKSSEADVLAVFRRVREEIREWILKTY